MIDYKTQLQEHTQHHNMGSLEYRIVNERGPAHEREFVSEVHMDNELLGRGSRSFQERSGTAGCFWRHLSTEIPKSDLNR